VAASAWAQTPEITALFPAGGRRGTEVTVKLQGKIDAGALKLWSDRPGVELVAAEGKDAVKLKIASDAPRGTMWLRFHNADGASALRPFLIGGCAELLETEPNDTLAKANAPAEFPVTINGVLEKAGEVDAFRVALRRGETLIAVLAAKQTLGSPMDGLLQIVDDRGFVHEQNDDQRGFDPRIIFTAPSDGAYFVRVFAFPAQPDTAIRFSGAPTYVYRLTLTTGPFADRVFPCAATSDQPAKVKLEGWNLPAELGDVDLPASPIGLQPVFRDGVESTARIVATPFNVIREQEPNPPAQPQSASVPAAVCGVVGEVKDVDAWKATLKAGQRVALRIIATGLGSALDAVVRISDAGGQRLAEIDDAPQDDADAVLEFTAPKDGDYVVTVTDRFAHGGPGYWYALTLSEPQPAAMLQVAGDAFVVKAETPLEIPVTIERRSGFALPLNISVEGLPEGVTADAVVSEPQGDSSKQVKLVVKSARSEPWGGPMRIVGRSEGDSQPERVARAKSPLTDDWMSLLWLTALPK
jgi:hypothetical protein